MNFIKVDTYEELSTKAAELIAAQVTDKPDSVLGLATGSTPIGTYKKLTEMCREGKCSFLKVRTINLDEYVGLDATHKQSYRYFMNNRLFYEINIDLLNTCVPNGVAKDLAKECAMHDKCVEAFGGIDLQLLGIGNNGHIGFNEPDDHFEEATHVVDLTPSTIAANARFFANESEVPRQAITMGMGAIMSAKRILLIANGKAKKDILEAAFHGEVTPKNPASILQNHPDVTVIYAEN